MNLNTLIDQFIGEEMKCICNNGSCISHGHNAKIQDLKSRKPELIEGIVDIIKNSPNTFGITDKDGRGGAILIDDLIKELTDKQT